MDRPPGQFGAGPSTPLLEAVRASVARHRLFRPGDRVLVAVSGGPDSVALLHALTRLGPDQALVLGVCHVHHGLRAEADGDAEFVRGLAARLGCPVWVERVVVLLGAGRSPEAAARVARFAALARVARAFGADRIALGHTADDQAETVLMRLLQGAGPRGLAGIPRRRGRLVRPLLEVDRATVLAHLHAHALPYVEDATNRDPKFLRNRIRHDLLPLLVALAGPRLPEALRRVGRAARETVEALDALLRPRVAAHLRPGPGGWTLDLAALRDLAPGASKALLRLALAEAAPAAELRAGLRAAHLDALGALAAAPAGAQVRLPGGVLVERGRDHLWIGHRGSAWPAVPVAIPGETPLPAAALVLTVEVTPAPPGRPADPAWEAWFDAGALPATLVARPRRPGERMIPFGGREPVRLGRFLAEAGTPRLARAQWPVLAGGGAGDEILWLIGVRRGAAAPVTAATRAMVRMRATPVPDHGPEEEAPS